MGNFALGLKTMFRIWGDASFADKVKQLDAPKAPVKPEPAAPLVSKRSDALSLLAVLQREARLVDFLMESIGGYSDAQIGAAVRDVHRGSAAVLQRVFNIQPLRTEA